MRIERRSVVFVLSIAAVLVGCGLVAANSFAQTTASGPQATATPTAGGNTRACSANPVLSGNAKAKKPADPKKSKVSELPDLPPHCLEVKVCWVCLGLFFQDEVRKQAWRIGQEQASEQAWSFLRYLDSEELVALTMVTPQTERISWKSGKCGVNISTMPVEDGYTRVQITTKFSGTGDSKDKFARPASIWPLQSNGKLEESLLEALKQHYTPRS